MDKVIAGVLIAISSVGTFLGVIPEKIIHDGSRTGERVGYSSYCHPEQGFVIYENEKMPFTTDDGKSVLWTKGDIDCYKESQLALTAIHIPINQAKETAAPKQAVTQPSQSGTRTGNIVSYKEFCKGGMEISVYENELITKTTSDGQTFSMTKDDWACFEKVKNVTSQQTQPNQAQGKLSVSIPCTTAVGSYTSYGNTQEEALSYCSKLQQDALTRQQQNQNTLDSIKQGYSNVVNQTFQLKPAPTIAPIPTSKPLPPIPKEPYCTYYRNSYGAVAQICN